MRNLVSIADITKNEIIEILDHAKKFKDGLTKKSLSGKVIGSCFFESSTRTRLSFETAVFRLGGNIIGFADSGSTSLSGKGESLTDTLRMVDSYADALIIRHPSDGAARLASEICSIPVINAGDGANQHPTQTLLDLFSIQDSQGKLDGINLGIMGDLKYGRAAHSLIYAARHFKMRLYFIAPQGLRMSDEHLFELKKSEVQYSFHTKVEEVISQLDCLYVTRLQKERFDNSLVFDNYVLQLSDLKNAKTNLKILHPLPRIKELPTEIDNTPYAYYFQQVKNGLYVREALLDILLGNKL